MTTPEPIEHAHAQPPFLVVGSGLAGLTFALHTAQHGPTILLTKKERAESNSNYAQGGIAGVMSADDDVRIHIEDTLVAGAGLCRPDAVTTLVREGPQRIRDLIKLGAHFSTEPGQGGRPTLALGREGGHSRNRIVHAVDRTGWECERTLLDAAVAQKNLTILEHLYVTDLAIDCSGGSARCTGVFALNSQTGEHAYHAARCVLLATGGCGQVYLHTTNPAIATGDGVAMAWRAGAAIANMEFIQFHPTALCHPKGNSFLITEAMRGEGGILRTADGSTFMENYHALGALAPRDIVARAIHAERTKRGENCVFLDVTHLPADFVQNRFPTIYTRCMELGLDITKQPIPVIPAAHYQCGGILTDLDGATGVDGLYACGEVACTGVHGANRLASNSLLEAMVFGFRAAARAIQKRGAVMAARTPEIHLRGADVDTESRAAALRSEMNDHVGIVRNTVELQTARAVALEMQGDLEQLLAANGPTEELCQSRNMATVAAIIAESALKRRESRGLHYTVDYPNTVEEERHDTVLCRGKSE